ncbi:MAG TPA: cobalamin B12-binding domain-containing protein, partial [Polyangia bacterium]
MHVALLGADFEENLGMGMIAAALGGAGHEVTVLPFGCASEAPGLVRRVLDGKFDVVGLSIQFQHRGPEFLGLARALKAQGFAGHITCGGQFPTLAWREVLSDRHGIDSIVMHEGEHAVVELLAALGSQRSLESVPGLALVGPEGPHLTAPRPLLE